MKLSIIVAATERLGIGLNGQLPWTLKKELTHFAKLTTATSDSTKQNVVIMGRKTWESIPIKFRPLKNRINFVLSRSSNAEYPEGVVLCNSFENALEILNSTQMKEKMENIWVIGGSSVYKEAINSAFCHRIYVTWIKEDFECDTFFPVIPEDFSEVSDTNISTELQEEGGIKYAYKVYEKVKPCCSNNIYLMGS